MNIKTSLRTALYAGEVLVAESDDPELWQRTLAAVTGAPMPPTSGQVGADSSQNAGFASDGEAEDGETEGTAEDAVNRFADSLGITRELVVGACDPSREEPYLHLDHHAWEAFRDNNPNRGPTAISPAALSATLLTLWFRAADLGEPTVPHINRALGTIGVRDRNPARGIRNCEWIQTRGDRLLVNPARISRAEEVARAYCSQEAVNGD